MPTRCAIFPSKLLAFSLFAFACLSANAQPPASPAPASLPRTTLYVSPTGGDWVTQVNALFASCPNPNPNQACDVHTPAGSYITRTGTVLMHTPNQSLSGDGPTLVTITASQQNVIDWRYPAGQFSFVPGASISGFTLFCNYNNPASTPTLPDHTRCITIGSVLGFNLHDLNLYGPGDITSGRPQKMAEAIVLQNTNNWAERWRITNVNFGGFATNLHFQAPIAGGNIYALVLNGGSGYSIPPAVTFDPPPAGGVQATGVAGIANGAVQQIIMTNNGSGYPGAPRVTLSGSAVVQAYIGTGTDSFGYGRLSGVWTNQGPGSMGVVVDAGANVYHTLGFDYQINSGNTTAADEYFHIAGNFEGVGFHVTSENAGTPFHFAHVLPGGHMQFEGTFDSFGSENSAYADPGGTFSILPASNFADTLSGLGSIPNYGGTGFAATVYPTQQLQQENPYVTAQEGYVEGPNGYSAPVFVHDPRMPLCFGTIAGIDKGQPMSNLVTTFCFYGNGNFHTPGSALLDGSLQAASASLNNKSSQAPVLSLTSDSTFGTSLSLANTSTHAAWRYGVESNFDPAPGAFYISTGAATPQFQVTPTGIAFTHPQSTGPAPKATALPGAGIGASVSLSPNSTDSSGFLTLNLGPDPSAGGKLFQVFFATPWSAAPKCWLVPASTDTGNNTTAAFVSPADITPTAFSSTLARKSPAAATSNTWAYKCEQ